MENTNTLKDASIAAVMEDIQNSQKTDVIVSPADFNLHTQESGETRIGATFRDYAAPVNRIALSQIETSLMPGFSVYGRNLHSHGMRDLYVHNANQLLRTLKGNRFVRMQQRPGTDVKLRAWLSSSYQRYDDDLVFGSLIDAVETAGNASEFRSIGGYRTDTNTYVKLVTKEPIFSVTADGRERNFSAGFIMSNSEVGQGFCRIEALLIDKYCTNGCIFSSSKIGTLKVMHRGRNFDDAVSGTLVDSIQGNVRIDRVAKSIETAVKAAFNKDLYFGYQDALKTASQLNIGNDDASVEAYTTVIGKTLNLTEDERKAITQRLFETGDRSLFGVQAALTDAAKYASDYDRKIELERAGGRIFTEIPNRWRTIQKLAEMEKLD